MTSCAATGIQILVGDTYLGRTTATSPYKKNLHEHFHLMGLLGNLWLRYFLWPTGVSRAHFSPATTHHHQIVISNMLTATKRAVSLFKAWQNIALLYWWEYSRWIRNWFSSTQRSLSEFCCCFFRWGWKKWVYIKQSTIFQLSSL